VTTETGAGARRKIVVLPREVMMTSFKEVKESVTFTGKESLPGKGCVFPGKACAIPSHAAADKSSTMIILCIIYFVPKTTMLD
jgi:hypothetical protein